MKKPSLSIIVPIYNVEDYLVACIDSILGQTFTDYELILINDGSPDRCGAMCDEYAEMDSRIIVIHQKNGGVSNARNSGLDVVRGDYITFIDPDDEYGTNTTLEDNMNILLGDSMIDIIQFPMIKYLNGKKADCITNHVGKFIEIKKDLFLDLIDATIRPFIWDKIYRREMFDALRFPKMDIGEDLYCMAHILEKVNRFVISTKGYYKYKHRSNSILNSAFTEKQFVDLIKVLFMIFDMALILSVPQKNIVPRFFVLVKLCDNAIITHGWDSYADFVEHIDRVKPSYLSIFRSLSRIGGAQVSRLLIIKTIGFKRYCKIRMK